MSNILVIDIGTSSMRGVLYDHHGQILHLHQVLYTPMYLSDNHVEQNPEDFENSLLEIALETVKWAECNNQSIHGISVTSQRSSAIPVDREGKPLFNTIMWQDKRTLDICSELAPQAKYVYMLSGSRINPVFTGPKHTWLKRHQPDIFKKAYKILVIPDYVVFLMTGDFVTDYTYGSRSAMMNIKTLEWDADLLKLFEADEDKLCRLEPQGSVVGHITPAFSRRSGLPSGIPVISAGGDQQCGALGSGVIENGSLQITTGTGSFLIASSDLPRLDEKQRAVCNVSAVQGKYILDSSILTTATIYNWYFENFYRSDNPGATMPDTINADAAASPVGSKDLILMPHFQGRGSPDWNATAKGMFFNVNLGITRGDFARAILEGIAAEISENVDVMRENVGDISTISVGGGLTKSTLFNQIQADFYKQKIRLSSNKEATSLGAWVSAAVTLRLHPSYRAALDAANKGAADEYLTPIGRNSEIYDRIKLRRKALYDALNDKGIYSMF